MSNTAFSEAFEKIGILPRDAEFNIAIAKYLNSGGDFVSAQALLDAAKQMTVAGQDSSASLRGHSEDAGDRQPLEGDEAIRSVSQDLRKFASSPSSPRGGDGHEPSAQPSQNTRAIPVREPTAAQRAAAARVRNVVSITVLDTFTIRDGRAIGDVRMGEVERLRAANAMEASIFRQIQRFAVAGHDQRIRDVIKPEEFQRMQQRASEVADAS